MKAVILAGGLGTRLQPYTTFLPKPMLPLGERPLLEHLIGWVRSNGIREVVLCVSYLRRAIEDYFGDGRRLGVSVEYAVSDRPLATAGQLKTAEGAVDGTFACMYGDSLYGFSLRAMARQHARRRPLITMALHEHATALPYGVIRTSRGGAVTGWDEKPVIRSPVNAGCYVMEPGVFAHIPRGRPYGMDRVVRRALARGEAVGSYAARGGFTDIGDMESYRRANQRFLDKLGRV